MFGNLPGNVIAGNADGGNNSTYPPEDGIDQYIDDDGTFFWNAEKNAYEHYGGNYNSFQGYYNTGSDAEPSGDATYIFNDSKAPPSFTISEGSPDYDGKLTLSEANEHYREGNGSPLLVRASGIDLSPVETGDFVNGVGSSIYKNFFLTTNLDTGRIYGTIRLTLQDANGSVSLGGSGFLDTYDFDQKKGNGTIGRVLRNLGTKVGEIVAGEGTGYKIYVYGTGSIKKTN